MSVICSGIRHPGAGGEKGLVGDLTAGSRGSLGYRNLGYLQGESSVGEPCPSQLGMLGMNECVLEKPGYQLGPGQDDCAALRSQAPTCVYACVRESYTAIYTTQRVKPFCCCVISL